MGSGVDEAQVRTIINNAIASLKNSIGNTAITKEQLEAVIAQEIEKLGLGENYISPEKLQEALEAFGNTLLTPEDIQNIINGVLGAYVELQPEDGKTLEQLLIETLASADTGELVYLKLPQNSTLNFTGNDLINFNNSLHSDADIGKKVSINLNGSTVNIPSSAASVDGVEIRNGGLLELSNGAWDFDDQTYANNGFTVGAGATLELTNMNVDIVGASGIFLVNTASEVVIENSNIYMDAYYGVCTNGLESSSVRVLINNSEVKNIVNGGGIGILLNVGSNLHVEQSHIAGNYHGIALRAGHAEIINSTVEVIATSTTTFDNEQFTHFPKIPKIGGSYIPSQKTTYVWADGNRLPGAVLVLGDYAREETSYPGDVDCTLSNVTLKTLNEEDLPKCLVAAKYGKNVKLSYDYSTNIGTPELYAYMIPEYFGSIEVNGNLNLLYEIPVAAGTFAANTSYSASALNFVYDTVLSYDYHTIVREQIYDKWGLTFTDEEWNRASLIFSSATANELKDVQVDGVLYGVTGEGENKKSVRINLENVEHISIKNTASTSVLKQVGYDHNAFNEFKDYCADLGINLTSSSTIVIGSTANLIVAVK